MHFHKDWHNFGGRKTTRSYEKPQQYPRVADIAGSWKNKNVKLRSESTDLIFLLTLYDRVVKRSGKRKGGYLFIEYLFFDACLRVSSHRYCGLSLTTMCCLWLWATFVSVIDRPVDLWWFAVGIKAMTRILSFPSRLRHLIQSPFHILVC